MFGGYTSLVTHSNSGDGNRSPHVSGERLGTRSPPQTHPDIRGDLDRRGSECRQRRGDRRDGAPGPPSSEYRTGLRRTSAQSGPEYPDRTDSATRGDRAHQPGKRFAPVARVELADRDAFIGSVLADDTLDRGTIGGGSGADACEDDRRAGPGLTSTLGAGQLPHDCRAALLPARGSRPGRYLRRLVSTGARLPFAAADWRALGCAVRLAVTDPAALGVARRALSAWLAEVDAACSRFRDDSEIVALDRSAGRETPVSRVLAGAVAAALRGAEQTSGDVDPTVGSAMAALGYDRDFALVERHGAPFRS